MESNRGILAYANARTQPLRASATDLTLNQGVPATLLVLSRAYTLTTAYHAPRVAPASVPEITSALQQTIKHLPEEVVKEVELDISEMAGVDAKQKRVRQRP